jgi:hypothetical protein
VDAAGIITTDESLKTEVVPGWSFVLCLIGKRAGVFLGNFEETQNILDLILPCGNR